MLNHIILFTEMDNVISRKLHLNSLMQPYLPSRIVHLIGFSANVAARPEMVSSASLDASPPIFSATTFTLPPLSLRLPVKVNW